MTTIENLRQMAGLMFFAHRKQELLQAAAELEALQAAIKLIEADAIACEQEAAKFKAKNDGINAYLMSTQAMAHRLDLKRLKP